MHERAAPTLPAPDPSTGLARLLGIDEVAAVLSVSRATVIRLADAGEIAETRIGSRRLFSPDAIRDCIARATSEAQRRNEERRARRAGGTK